tara:strand:- start:1176 stop:1451 length:276 start_codon:yes stop_codon:yes gene_type:complete
MSDCSVSFGDLVKKYSSPVDSKRVEIGAAAGNKLRELNTAIQGCQCELADYQGKKDKLVALVQAVESTDSEASLVALGQHLGLVKPTEGCD